ncbi:hypothetical protein Trichorick_00100 [Candidatus Trichorickettsia mobilis]|uniref:Uncharacterized protein n=1 Tax=Candidatus Trichorickettsia mobilis TaxID=1346319 RepID=A0ABZ0UQA7_9RICK|nr:hypothetical protein [Candidatus Trichorickettsia mobilis]WPY00228.1 hypothetical protein Trichorick_00100 [Candidatus Trichorickettsia mobilis]
MKNIAEATAGKIDERLQVLQLIIEHPEELANAIQEHPDTCVRIRTLGHIAAKYQLLEQLLTSQILTPVIDHCNVDDFISILGNVHRSDNFQVLFEQIFDIAAFKSKIKEYLTNETIAKGLALALYKCPTIINKLPIEDILNLGDINLLSKAFTALVKSNDNHYTVLDYCNFNNKAHKEAFEAMILNGNISKTARTELLSIVLEHGERFNYIDAPRISYNKEHIKPAIQKVIDNIYTNLDPANHQLLADRINWGLTKFYGTNLVITDIINHGLSKSIYIGTGHEYIPNTHLNVGGSSTKWCILIKKGNLLLKSVISNDFIDTFAELIHEATHMACGEFFDNNQEPYSNQIREQKEQEFVESYHKLVQQPLIEDMLSDYYHPSQYEREFIAYFITRYVQYCITYSLWEDRALSFKQFAPLYLNSSKEEHQETGRLLQKLADYLDDVTGFIRIAHNSLTAREETAINQNIHELNIEEVKLDYDLKVINDDVKPLGSNDSDIID